MLDISFWQVFWFLVIGVALTVFIWLDGFDLGIGMRLPFLSSPNKRLTAMNVIWPLWDGNELYGLIGGGAIFATFPVVFTGLLGGLYPWLVLLLIFVMIRPVTFEAWLHEPKNKKFWEVIFMLASFFIPFIVGVAVGGTIAGLPFDESMMWAKGHSMFEVLSPFSIACGLSLVLVCILHGSSYLIKKTSGEITEDTQKDVKTQAILVSAAFVLTIAIAFIQGVVDFTKPLTAIGIVLSGLILLCSLALVFLNAKKQGASLFWSSSLMMVGLWIFVASLQFPVMVHSSLGSQFDLSIFKEGVSNPVNSLQFIGIVGAIALAIVLVYTILVYKIFKGKVDHKTNVHY